MRTRKLGSHGPEISVLGFGAWAAGGTSWGPNESDHAVVGAIRAGLDAGIDWIDTAEVYGNGESERLVGLAVAGRRDDVVIASKVAPASEGSGFRPDQVRAACDASLRRLGTDRIDLYQLHWPDSTGVPVEDTWGAMVELREAGKIRYLGVSNFDRDLIERCEAIAHVDSLQQELSMLVRTHRELIAWCGEAGTGVVSYGPLAYGLLTGTITLETRFVEGDWRGDESDDADSDDPDEVDLFNRDTLPAFLALVDGVRPVAERLGITLAQLALGWNIAQAGVTAAIAGSRDAAHARSNAEAAEVALDRPTLDELERLLQA